MTGRNRRDFSTEFCLEAAQLVLDQHYSLVAAATTMNVGRSTMDKWVRQLNTTSIKNGAVTLGNGSNKKGELVRAFPCQPSTARRLKN